jgi:hypothetical protein
MDYNQEAFEAFMLGGKTPPMNTPSPSISSTPGSSSKKSMKRYGPVLKAFQGRLQEWKDSDDQLHQVLNSIVNLRNRIWWEKKNLDQASMKPKLWAGCGYRTHNQSLVLPDDVEMALSRDLLQHERMLSGARALISSMAQAQEVMGRRLDDFFQLEEEAISDQGKIMLDQTLAVFHFLGEELYCKQVLISEVLDSCHNGLVDEAALENLAQNSNPRLVAQKCYNRWSSRGEKKEEWLLVDELLSGRI